MASSSYTAASELGNGTGYIYQMDHLGTTVLTSMDNNIQGVKQIKELSVADTPLSAGTKAFSSTQIVSVTGTGTITNVTITRGGAINQINTAVPFVPATTPTALATLIAAEVNATHPPTGINYSAVAIGDSVTMYAEEGIGSVANSDVLTWTVTGGTIVFNPTSVTSKGGFNTGTDYTYSRYFIDTTGDGTASTPSAGYVEITEVIVPKSAQSGVPTQSLAIVSDIATYDRKGRISYVRLTTEGGAASDDLATIATNTISDGDIVVIMRNTTGQTITVRSTGNLNLTGAPTNFVIDTDNKSIWFLYRSSASAWEEIFRTSVEDITDAGLRTLGISVGKSGSSTKIIVAAGGTTALVPGTDAKDIIWNGTGVTLLGSAVLTAGGSPIDGDPFYIHYLPVTGTGGNTVTIFGQVLSENQATQGVLAFAFYDSAIGAWRARIAVDAAINYVENTKIPNSEIQAVKLANSGVVAGSYTFSNLTVNAQGLITTAASGVGESGGVLHSIVSSVGTAANTAATDLHAYTMPANTMITNGDILIVKCMFTTAANANAKTLSLYFGSTVLATITANLNAQDLVMESTITRYATANQLSITTNYYTTTGGGAVTTEAYDDDSMTENLAADVIIKTLGQNGVAAANDIISRTLMVTLFKR